MTEISRLWDELRHARARGDDAAVQRIEAALRDAGPAARFAHLSDDELRRRIASLDGNREAEDQLAHSPGGGTSGDVGVGDLQRLNTAIREQQHVGVEELRNALVDELERRAAG